MCAPPSCHPAAAQAEPGDLHELVQDTSASVSRISSNGESVPRPTSCLWRSSHTGWWVATASPHSAPCSQTPRPLLCPAPPAHTALLHLSPQCLPPPVARVMQASPCREGACESLAQPGRPGPLTGHCGGGWGGGAGAITTRPGPVLSSHRPGDMGQAGLAAPSWGKGGVCPNLELSGQ